MNPYLDVAAVTVNGEDLVDSETAVIQPKTLSAGVRYINGTRGLTLIKSAVAGEYGLSEENLHERTRTKAIAEARQLCFWIARSRTRLSYPEIARAFGMDHTTVMAGVKRIDVLREKDPPFRRLCDRVLGLLPSESSAPELVGFETGRHG